MKKTLSSQDTCPECGMLMEYPWGEPEWPDARVCTMSMYPHHTSGPECQEIARLRKELAKECDKQQRAERTCWDCTHRAVCSRRAEMDKMLRSVGGRCPHAYLEVVEFLAINCEDFAAAPEDADAGAPTTSLGTAPLECP